MEIEYNKSLGPIEPSLGDIVKRMENIEQVHSEVILKFGDDIQKLEKEVKSLRGMVFLAMKRKKNNE